MKAAYRQVLVLLCLVLLLILVPGTAAQDGSAKLGPNNDTGQQHQTLAPVMVKKLQHTHQLMTSLCTEDFARMADDARELKLIGESTLMKVSPNLDYVKCATEFSSITEELGRRAKAHDLNGATSSYIRLTMNCIECHKYVRDKNILGRNR